MFISLLLMGGVDLVCQCEIGTNIWLPSGGLPHDAIYCLKRVNKKVKVEFGSPLDV